MPGLLLRFSGKTVGDAILSVLVVEDEPAIAQLVTMALEDDGHAVRCAQHGAFALDILAAWTPDVVVLDLKMPVMDGWEFLRRLELDHRLRVPVVVLTAVTTNEERNLREKVESFLTKPFEIADLLAEVRRVARSGNQLTRESRRPYPDGYPRSS